MSLQIETPLAQVWGRPALWAPQQLVQGGESLDAWPLLAISNSLFCLSLLRQRAMDMCKQ